MTYNHKFMRLVMSGSLFGTEGWSMGLAIGDLAIDDSDFGADVTEVPEAIYTACAAWFGGTSLISNHALLETVKYNAIGHDGHYVDPTGSVRYDWDDPVVGGGGGSIIHPAQIALVVSLTTGHRRGPAHQGRMYLPPCAFGVGTDGRISLSDAEGAAGIMNTFITDLNGADTDHGTVQIVSNVGSGEMLPVTGIKVGRVFDTLRSRRRSLLEGYTVSAL